MYFTGEEGKKLLHFISKLCLIWRISTTLQRWELFPCLTVMLKHPKRWESCQKAPMWLWKIWLSPLHSQTGTVLFLVSQLSFLMGPLLVLPLFLSPLLLFPPPLSLWFPHDSLTAYTVFHFSLYLRDIYLFPSVILLACVCEISLIRRSHIFFMRA